LKSSRGSKDDAIEPMLHGCCGLRVCYDVGPKLGLPSNHANLKLQVANVIVNKFKQPSIYGGSPPDGGFMITKWIRPDWVDSSNSAQGNVQAQKVGNALSIGIFLTNNEGATREINFRSDLRDAKQMAHCFQIILDGLLFPWLAVARWVGTGKA
jgi:hypothetical protein